MLREFDPSSAAVRRWGWWRMYEGYGAAARSYALAALTGRARGRTLDPRHLQRCRQEIVDHGRDLVRAAADSAYGVSYPDESKRGLRAGWFFPEDAVFDLVVARLLAPSRDLDGSISSNLAFSGGGGPTNVTFVTGLGERWPREIVHQVARNDRRALPPSGIPVGNLRERPAAATPIYDRYSDVFDVTTDATITTIGRGMAASALLMARTPLAAQPWQAPVSSISGGEAGVAPGDRVVLTLQAPGLSLAGARVVWEAAGVEPYQGTALMLAPVGPGPWWVEGGSFRHLLSLRRNYPDHARSLEVKRQNSYFRQGYKR